MNTPFFNIGSAASAVRSARAAYDTRRRIVSMRQRYVDIKSFASAWEINKHLFRHDIIVNTALCMAARSLQAVTMSVPGIKKFELAVEAAGSRKRICDALFEAAQDYDLWMTNLNRENPEETRVFLYDYDPLTFWETVSASEAIEFEELAERECPMFSFTDDIALESDSFYDLIKLAMHHINRHEEGSVMIERLVGQYPSRAE